MRAVDWNLLERFPAGIEDRDAAWAVEAEVEHRLGDAHAQRDGKVVGAVSVCGLKEGGLGIIITSLNAGSWQENVTLHGDNFTVEVDAFERLVVKKDDYEKVFGVDRPGKWIPEMKERGFLGEIEHFFDCVANRQQPLTNAYDALKTHKLIEQLIEVADLKPNLPPKNGWDEISRWNT